VTSPARPLWELWAPPLSPPAAGGLPYDVAEAIVESWWADDNYLAMAMLWEAYALTLPPEPAVSAVSTGVQSVTYAAGGGGAFGIATARAQWFRGMAGSGGSVPLHLAPPHELGLAGDEGWWEVDAG
jgi:hypothetical protein